MTARRNRLLVGAAALLTLSACGDQPGFDAGSVEDYLVSSQRDAYPGAEVGGAHCPSPLDLEEGMSFRCTLSVSGTEVPYSVRLTRVHSASPRVAVDARGIVVRASAAQRYLASSLPKTATGAKVDCGAAYLVVEEGDEVTCAVSLGGQREDVALHVGSGGVLTVAG